MQSTLDFFSWAFEGKPRDQQIIICIPDKYLYHGEEKSIFRAYNCQTAQKAAILADKYTQAKKDVYYTLTTYTDNEEINATGRTKISRAAKYARTARIIGFDVDCGDGKPYATYEEALPIAKEVITNLGIDSNSCTFIKSGGGLHGYFKLNEFISKEKWIYLATGLKAYFLSSRLEIDKSKLTDPAMLLRPAGSYNFKKAEPRKVELIQQGAKNYTFDELQKILAKYLPDYQEELTEIVELPPSLLEINEYADGYSPVSHVLIQEECAQLKALAKDSNVSEALWYSALGVAAFTSDPKAAAIEWSKNCSTYNEYKTIQKMEQWKKGAKGPATCSKFNELNAALCIGCKYDKKITTPLQTAKQQPAQIIGEKGVQYTLPPNYKVVKDWLYKYNEELSLPISEYIVYLDKVARYYDIRKPITYLRLKCNIPRIGWIPVEVELNALTGGTASRNGESFSGVMGGIGVALDKKHMMFLQNYVIDAYKHYQRTKDIGKVWDQMGWTENKSFVHGLSEYKGATIPSETITPKGETLGKLAKHMVKSGSMQDWLEIIRLLSLHGLELQAFGYLLAYGAPLLKFTGLNGCTVCFYSIETGTGKSTAPKIAMSVYGNPKYLSGSKKDSDVNIMTRFGETNNLPVYTDEMTELRPEEASDLLYCVSEGQGRGRGTKDGGIQESKHWSLIFMISSNKSMYEKLEEHTKSSAGQKARLLEIQMNQNPVMDTKGKAIHMLLEDNYGHAAEPFLNKLVDLNKSGELTLGVRNALDEFEDEFEFTFTSQERFIRAVIGATWYGAKIASELGLCPSRNANEAVFDLHRIFTKVLHEVRRNRTYTKEAVIELDDVINQMIAHTADKWVRVMLEGTYKTAVAPRQKCVGRIELIFRDNGKETPPTGGRLYICVSSFEDFCKEKKLPWHAYTTKLAEQNILPQRINLMNDVKFTVDGQMAPRLSLKCYNIELPASMLTLFKKEPLPEETGDTSFQFGDNL